MNWISKNGPWLFYRSLIVLEVPKTNQRSVDLGFKKVEFWIRIINLPIAYWNETIARKIGNILGEFIRWDENQYSNPWGNNIRIIVLLDISNPLRRGFMLRTKEAKERC